MKIPARATTPATSLRETTETLIKEVALPALDASGKDPASMTVKFSPTPRGGGKASGPRAVQSASVSTKRWLKFRRP
ncbi:MAG: hypothetical protein HYR60_14405 [Acidobacteria bacterium]|nr:hypothetical protein [Acidobacteriota bacterium]